MNYMNVKITFFLVFSKFYYYITKQDFASTSTIGDI